MSEIGQKIIAGIRKLAEEQPDFRYQPPDGDSCVYVHDGEGSCGVGRVLLDLGLITPELEHDRTTIRRARINSAGATELLGHLKVSLDPSECEWITRYQDEQDSERAWGWAVGYADEETAL